MEIERKFLISKENLPANLDSYPHRKLEQGYVKNPQDFCRSIYLHILSSANI